MSHQITIQPSGHSFFAQPGETVQFERLGYFCADPDATPGAPVFNRTLTLKDTWAKVQSRTDGA